MNEPPFFELRRTIAELLDIPVEKLADDAYLATTLDTDSLMDVALVLEDAHGIRFSEPDLVQFTCLTDVADCLSRTLERGDAQRIA
jgi:acyl carrier protein